MPQTQYIVAAFIGGTALCAGSFYASWLYTKQSMGGSDVGVPALRCTRPWHTRFRRARAQRGPPAAPTALLESSICKKPCLIRPYDVSVLRDWPSREDEGGETCGRALQGKEYAQKMREITPNTMEAMDEGAVGRAVRDFKQSFGRWIAGNGALQRFSSQLRVAPRPREPGTRHPARHPRRQFKALSISQIKSRNPACGLSIPIYLSHAFISLTP